MTGPTVASLYLLQATIDAVRSEAYLVAKLGLVGTSANGFCRMAVRYLTLKCVYL